MVGRVSRCAGRAVSREQKPVPPLQSWVEDGIPLVEPVYFRQQVSDVLLGYPTYLGKDE
jgi:hypothetical protein